MHYSELDGTVRAVTLPDLLHPVPLQRLDAETANLSIVMAFAGGASSGLFAELLARAHIAPSSFRPEAYVHDLFLKNFVTEAFRARIDGVSPVFAAEHLLRLIANPPSDSEVVHYRRAIIWELMNGPALRTRCERLYLALCRFRNTLEGSSLQASGESNRRQLGVLEHFKDVIALMAEGFDEAQSGLRCLASFGAQVQGGEGFKSLLELLSYDERLAAIDFRVAVGADGRVRKLELVEVRETRENAFVNPPWKRWLAKLELFARGFSFGDGEVMARLLDAVFEGVREAFLPLIQLMGDLEFYLGALGFSDRAEAAGLAVSLPELVAAEQPRQLLGLFNPLLLSTTGRPVPCDISIDRHDTTVLITGPNSGGKTRLLQALGLAQLLAQAGLFVPARAAQMVLAPGLVVSLIQETKVDQTEGRLGMELVRIRGLFESLPQGAMVILDELCSGTNPSEGEEIFELVLQMLALLKPQAFITTHFLDFASRLQKKRQIEGLRFLQVVLGPRHEPTYQFAPGVASTSLASHTAARLGVTGDQLLALIERNIAATSRAGS